MVNEVSLRRSSGTSGSAPEFGELHKSETGELMSGQRDFYLERAAEARADAEATKLANVRERFLRSEAAWNHMAARVAATERRRIENGAFKPD
jgi:hypothetical protein